MNAIGRVTTSAALFMAAGAALGQEPTRLVERARQDREIVYFLRDPDTHAFDLDHDFTETREGMDRYLNVVRQGSTVSNPSARILDTGEALKPEILKGAAITAAGLDTGEPVRPDSEVVVVRYPAITRGGTLRLRISETYTDPARYRLEGDQLVWDRSFGRPRNAVVLPAGWMLTANSIPATISETDDGRIRLDFVNPRPDEIAVLIKARRRAAPASAAVAEGPRPAQPDHLILGISDLDEGIRLFHEQTGVRPMPGGAHPGRGTQNALVSLGRGPYIEIVAPAAAAPPAGTPDPVPGLRGLARLTPIGWAVSVPRVEDARQLLTSAGFEVSTARAGSRTRPDGSRLEWETFGLTRPQLAGVPFFIRWSDGARHPSQDSPPGCRLERLSVVSPTPDEVERVLRAVAVEVPVERGPQGGLSVTLACPKGTARFAADGPPR